MNLFRTPPLERALAARSLNSRAQARYLIGSFLVFVVPGYLGLLPSSGAGYTIALAFEAWFYIAITVLGITTAREAAGGDANPTFITEFTCLYLPIAITTLLPVWSLYWLCVWQFGDTLAFWSWSGMQFTENLRAINTDLIGLITFVAHVAANSLIYWRICRALRRVQSQR